MSAEDAKQYAEALRALSEAAKDGGPYAVIIVLAWAYWKKDNQVNQLHQSILTSSVKNVETFGAFKAAFESLAEVIKGLATRF